ncbi:MAG: hypothetical protein AAFU70_05130 [Planctomycetota bacterium]
MWWSAPLAQLPDDAGRHSALWSNRYGLGSDGPARRIALGARRDVERNPTIRAIDWLMLASFPAVFVGAALGAAYAWTIGVHEYLIFGFAALSGAVTMYGTPLLILHLLGPRARTEFRSWALSYRHCPHCGKRLPETEPDEDGLTRCPDCHARWRLERTAIETGRDPSRES